MTCLYHREVSGIAPYPLLSDFVSHFKSRKPHPVPGSRCRDWPAQDRLPPESFGFRPAERGDTVDLMIPIDRSDSVPLVEQVYRGILAAIEEETLTPGTRVPSTREFARQLGITRFTVDDAYSRLVGEGYLDRPSWVGHIRCRPCADAGPRTAGSANRLPLPVVSFPNGRSGSISPTSPRQFMPSSISRPGHPRCDKLPQTVWQRIIAREARQQAEATVHLWRNGRSANAPRGDRRLRRPLARSHLHSRPGGGDQWRPPVDGPADAPRDRSWLVGDSRGSRIPGCANPRRPGRRIDSARTRGSRWPGG